MFGRWPKTRDSDLRDLTNEVNKDPISSGVFRRISTRTGGKAYFAKTWQKQVEAFEDIREDLVTRTRSRTILRPIRMKDFARLRGDPVGRGKEVSRTRPSGL